MVNIPAIRADIVAAIEQMDRVICPISHYHAPGVYVREMMIPAGTIAIGHRHKTEHLCTLVQGVAIFYKDDEKPQMMTGPATFVSGTGHKIVYAATDIIVQNAHPNPDNIRDLDLLEKKYVDYIVCRSEEIDRKEDFEMLGIDHTVADAIELPPGFESVISIRKSPIHGKGVFASCPFSIGEYIVPFKINGRETIVSKYINHAEDACTGIIRATKNEHFLTARKPILGTTGDSIGHELTINYREL